MKPGPAAGPGFDVRISKLPSSRPGTQQALCACVLYIAFILNYGGAEMTKHHNLALDQETAEGLNAVLETISA